MALQVWLPLNKEGDFQNRGLADITVTNNGATYNSSGKVGGCYTFGDGSASSKGINIDNNFTTLGASRSVCAWVNPKGNHLHYSGTIASSGNWNNMRWAFCLNQDNTGLTGFDNEYSNYFTTPIPTNTWTHLCVTVDNNVTKFYKNGVYLGEQARGSTFKSDANNTMIGRETYASGYFTFNGDISDVRIYDHCLSPKEVKEISKALVLHYPLNDAYVEGTTNLVTRESGSTYTNNVWGGHTYTSIVSDFSSEPIPTNVGNTITITYDSSSGLGGVNHQLANPFTVTANTIYTYSLYIKSEDIDTCFHVNYLYFYGDTSGRSCANRNNRVYIGNGWYRYWGTFTTGSEQTTLNPYFYVYPRKNTTYYIAGAQIEQKDHMTPYVFGTRASSTVYDCSGYSNNGTITGSLSCSDDSPRYKVSTYFSAPTNKIALPAINYSGFGNSYTFSWWAKGTPDMMWGFENGNRLNIPYVGLYANTGDGSGNPFYTPGTTTTITDPRSSTEFKHYVAVGDGSTLKLYVNGVHYGTAKTYKALTGTLIYINGWNASGSYGGTEYVSDFRIYATALSADDVKELYNTSAMVCNNGTMLAYELEE